MGEHTQEAGTRTLEHGRRDHSDSRERTSVDDDDRTDSLDLECTERVEIGVTRGETDLEVGPPRDYPDRADVSIRPVTEDEDRIVLSIDAMAGDHATGHADVTLTPEEARTLAAHLDRTVRWLVEPDDAGDDE